MRLIDADEIHNLVRNSKNYMWSSPISTDRKVTVSTDDIQFGVDKIPTIDAEPVVHCKDCSRRDKNDRNWCDFFMCAISVETGFCYKGLRKELYDASD